jgi:mono/diheme cytochrome c family protein
MSRSSLLIILLLLIAASLSACGGSTVSAKEITSADPAAGQALFMSSCVACHGPKAEGLPGLGKNLVASDFVAGQTDQELVEFLKVGRPPTDPLNTTGVLMPPKGGRADLTDQDLHNIVAYLRGLQP